MTNIVAQALRQTSEMTSLGGLKQRNLVNRPLELLLCFLHTDLFLGTRNAKSRNILAV